tara:strand:+ start:185 stop:658 length:474 start_codon:yes stop_codon:yes gene_type:complete
MFTFKSIDGHPISLSDFRGKAILVVNTASRCGFTSQYQGLQSLWETYRDKGLVVLGVPSNDFGGQEPGTEKEIKAFCSINFDIDFPMTEKQSVRGKKAHPFYLWAENELGPLSRPRWNFYKILIGKNGQAVDWFASSTTPSATKLISAIHQVLKNPK